MLYSLSLVKLAGVLSLAFGLILGLIPYQFPEYGLSGIRHKGKDGTS